MINIFFYFYFYFFWHDSLKHFHPHVRTPKSGSQPVVITIQKSV